MMCSAEVTVLGGLSLHEWSSNKGLKSKQLIGMHYATVRGGISQYFEEITEPNKLPYSQSGILSLQQVQHNSY